jgi:hypothetical protein
MIASRPTKVEISLPNLRLYPVIFLEGLRKTTKDLIQDMRYPRQNSNREFHKYNSEILPLQST